MNTVQIDPATTRDGRTVHTVTLLRDGFPLGTHTFQTFREAAECAALWEADQPRQWLGDCDWCSAPVYSDQAHEDGRGGEGVMHLGCATDHA